MAKKRKLSAKAKQRQSERRLKSFIKKYGYDPRFSYRPKNRSTTGISRRGRPTSKQDYSKELVKSANERLRKLEKVYKFTDKDTGRVYSMADWSNEYRMVKKYATEYPNSYKGKIYRVSDDGKSIRFISKSEYDKLSAEEKRYFNEVLQNFLNAETSKGSGVSEQIDKAYKTFMQNYGDKYASLSKMDYMELFTVYRDQVTADKANHFDYDSFARIITNLDVGALINDRQLEEAIRYVETNNWHKIPRKYNLHN